MCAQQCVLVCQGLYLLFLLDRCTTSETFHDMQIAVAPNVAGNDHLITVTHLLASYHCLKNSCEFPNNIRVVSLSKKINLHNLQLSTSHCGPYTEDEVRLQFSAIASKKVRAP